MSRFSSLSDLKKKEAEDEGKRNEYFAGGLDQRGGGSGLAVVGPPSDPRRGGRPMPSGSGGDVFDAVVSRASQAGAAPPLEGGSAGGMEYRVALYRNGFTVNDGPLRDPNEPENRAFMLALMEQRIPDEIARAVRERGGRADELDVSVEDKRSEDYKPPTPPPYVAFSGSGNSLGTVVRGDAFIFRSSNLTTVLSTVAIDESAPVTTVQVRTATGKRLRVRVNQQMTVLQLAALIVRESGAEGSDVSFTLSAGFPPQDLSNALATVAEAGLLNAMVTQKTL